MLLRMNTSSSTSNGRSTVLLVEITKALSESSLYPHDFWLILNI